MFPIQGELWDTSPSRTNPPSPLTLSPPPLPTATHTHWPYCAFLVRTSIAAVLVVWRKFQFNLLESPIRIQAMEAALKAEYNDSQMKALTGGLAGQEVVLIQV